MRKPRMPDIPEPVAPASPPSLATARTGTPMARPTFIPPNIRTGARGLQSAATTQKRSLIGG
jgi:hypothetical protein